MRLSIRSHTGMGLWGAVRGCIAGMPIGRPPECAGNISQRSLQNAVKTRLSRRQHRAKRRAMVTIFAAKIFNKTLSGLFRRLGGVRGVVVTVFGFVLVIAVGGIGKPAEFGHVDHGA